MKLEKLTERDIIRPADFDVVEDFIDPLQSKIAEVLKKISKDVDSVIFENYAKYGYSREWLLDPTNRDRIRMVRIGGNILCGIDNVDLFTVEIHVARGSAKIFDVSTAIKIHYHTPSPKED